MDEKKDNREESNSKVVATPEIALGDSEILGTPKNQQKDKKRRKKQKKVDQDTLLKSKKLQKHKLRRKKQKKVVTTTEPSEIDSDDPKKLKKPSLFSLHLDLSMGKKMKRRHESGVEITPEISLGDSEILVTPKNQQKAKKRKKQNKIESKKNLKKVEIIQEPESNKNLKKIIDGLSDRLNEMTEIVQKLKETSDLLEKEKETPKKKVVECCFESEDAFRNHQKTVFVEGFRCSPPRGDIKSALIKHFSPCGEVSTVLFPFIAKPVFPWDLPSSI
ncbi:uncharacterized protein LOC130505466 isoform X1 [Raphanus sativus]|uniref:Uncharacterized protein LOC130505466 isoform X1 n=1 Tax=Raphanus sativus TaxID=3726 RepID=A0A9W3CX08_RAPSA|nr:uncharacterized protein LOC130505466 isoform X1 [Raphanus sativus]